MKIKNLFILLICMLFLGGCSCHKISSKKYINLEKTLREDRFSRDTVFLLFNEKYFDKQNFRIKQHPKVDSVTGSIYTLKSNGENLFWKYSDKFLKFDGDIPYLENSEEIETILAVEIPPYRIISSTLLVKMEDEKIFQNLINKYLYILEEAGDCEYKIIPIGFGSGFGYSEKYE